MVFTLELARRIHILNKCILHHILGIFRIPADTERSTKNGIFIFFYQLLYRLSHYRTRSFFSFSKVLSLLIQQTRLFGSIPCRFILFIDAAFILC